MIITAFNPTTEQLEKTYLSSATSAGVTSLTVKNNNRFVATDRIMIGEITREKTEMVTLSAVSGVNGMTVGATTFSHDTDDPVYRLRYDQVKFYRSTSGSGGTYSLLSTQDLDVDNADNITIYDDTTGVSTYYYKISYYNSVSTQESSLSDPIPGAGYPRNTVGYIVDEILRLVGDSKENVTDRTEVISWLNDCSDDMLSKAVRPYSFLHSRTTLTRTAARNYIDFPTDSNGDQTMWKFDRMDYNFVDASTSTDVTYTLRVISPEEFRNRFDDNTIDSTTEDDETQLMAIDDAVDRFRFQPPFETTSAGVFYLYYWKFFTTLDSEGDELETPTIRPYRLYALSSFYRKKAASDSNMTAIADRYLADYTAEVARLSGHNRKDQGSPRSFGYLPQNNRGNRGF